jgi:hypothetical protein
VTDRVIVDTEDYNIGALITKDGSTCYTVVSKIRTRHGYRYGLKLLEAFIDE